MSQHLPPFRKQLLPATIEFVCKYWRYSNIVEDYHIGEAILSAQQLAELRSFK